MRKREEKRARKSEAHRKRAQVQWSEKEKIVQKSKNEKKKVIA